MGRFVIGVLLCCCSKETLDWKARYSFAFCISCCEGSNNNKHEGEQADLCTPTTSSDECKISSSKPSPMGPSLKKRKKSVKSFRSCLPMDKRVEIIHFAAKKSKLWLQEYCISIQCWKNSSTVDNQEERGNTNRLPE